MPWQIISLSEVGCRRTLRDGPCASVEGMRQVDHVHRGRFGQLDRVTPGRRLAGFGDAPASMAAGATTIFSITSAVCTTARCPLCTVDLPHVTPRRDRAGHRSVGEITPGLRWRLRTEHG